MTNAVDSGAISGFQFNTFAEITERAGLAIMGALGSFFVAALVSRANIGEINSVEILLCVILYSAVGFYLGTNIPSLPASAPYFSMSGHGAGFGSNPYALISAIGTLLAAVAAQMSVFMIVFDEVPALSWIIGIGSFWMLGVLLKLAAGTAARFHPLNSAAAQPR
jgi:hypothetical protein